MVKNNPGNVSAAFEMVLEEIEIEINSLDSAAAKASEEHDRKSAREALDAAEQITSFRDKVVSLRKEWQTLTSSFKGKSHNETTRAESNNMRRLQRGLRTPETTFYQPIIHVLVELGGSAKLNEVLAKLEPRMKGILTSVDYEPVSSDPDLPRWRNTAQWARNTMVKEGLLKQDSPRGIWEITEAGRRYLARGNH